MRMHTPTLYTHPEQDINEDQDAEWPVSLSQTRTSPSTSSTNTRMKSRPKRSSFGSSPSFSKPNTLNNFHSSSQVTDVYSQFVKRYRSSNLGDESDDPRSDPDSHYFHRGLGQLVDAGDSDDENLSRATFVSGADGMERVSLLLESESTEPASQKEKDRLNWQIYFASVLGGDVLRSEKSRIAVALEASVDEQNPHLNRWLGIRARIHGRTVQEERKFLEERRIRLVDPLIKDINTFRLETRDISHGLSQIQAVLRRLDIVHSLYPNIKAFYLDKSEATELIFQARCDTLNTWATVIGALRHQVAVLKRWTGSETLDVTQPNTSGEIPMHANQRYNVRGEPELADGSSFVERMLKEESMQRMFEKGSLVTVHASVAAARDAQVNLAGLFEEMNLPTFESELLPLISFPTKLAQACLHLRLAYIQKIKEPDMLILDQMIDDLKLGIGLACTLKRQYEAFLAPDPDGRWNLPPCISEDYDASILDSMSMFFRLVHWKLKGGAKGVYFKETDVLEAQWATLNDVSLTVSGGSCLVAEQICSLTNRLMVRVKDFFETQVHVPTSDGVAAAAAAAVSGSHSRHRVYGKPARDDSNPNFEEHMTESAIRVMTDEQKVIWYSKILDSVRLRYRKLQRFARVLTHRFSNSAEYSLEGFDQFDHFIECLVATDHFLVYTSTYEEDGVYIVASNSLFDRSSEIPRIFTEAFQVYEIADEDGAHVIEQEPDYEDSPYLLVLSPRHQFTWRGRVMLLELPKISLEMKDDRVRLIADGPQARLAVAKHLFMDSLVPMDENGEILPLACLTDQQAHLPRVNRELRKIAQATMRLAESIVESVHHVHNSMRMSSGCQELMENWYLFASEHGQHAQKFMDRPLSLRFNRMLIKLAISWVSFICDDCTPGDRKTFKWAVNALEFTFQRTKRNILHLPDEQFQMLRQKVGTCITLLMGHFDILGARSSLVALREKERLEKERLPRTEAFLKEVEHNTSPDDGLALLDTQARNFWTRVSQAIQEVEGQRVVVGHEFRILGRVLDTEKPEDRSLVFLASSTFNISIRWQQGRFIGAGAFGSVYLAVNLDTGGLMAVKEIKFQELSGITNLYAQIKDELSVMELLHHPNVVEYYGIEVHRDKVYIFEEYCQGGSLAASLAHGRIEDERIIQVYTMQMLEGLAYLHSKGIVHRDIKPDNILLDHLGVIKFVDFGAAKILAKNQRSVAARSRRAPDADGGGTGGMDNSLTGTPMYMSPEIIKNDKRGRHGAMDIWSLGCVVLECATGRKPWSNLDNEWAIMFHIGVATQHPPLPEPDQLTELGIAFIKQCLTIDAIRRPSAEELLGHPWMIEFQEALASYEEDEIANDPPAELPPDDSFANATVARQAVIIQGKEVEDITRVSPTSELASTPDETSSES